ncbi:nineteen complex-related protein 2-domain-containing protein [Butyriboletus roseoflavus]|nr:nineteen complex-related protein 2-domain-containing protein [Butyriboletus roseoflavus]
MSDQVIFKKSTSRPVQRARDLDLDLDSDEPSTANTPITLASKLKSKAKRAHPKSRLSFGADDEASEEPSFQLKKSNLSRKLTLGSHPASLPTTLDQATISTRSNGGPVYDQAYLSELKASTFSARPPTNNNICDADAFTTVDEGTLQFLGSSEATETVIPSQSRIVAAKERRERLRVGTAEQEYISLSVTKQADISHGPHPESRLVREEDEVGEGDDEYAEYTSARERIALGKKARKAEATKRRDTIKEMISEVVDEDEETLEWERAQLRRGGHDPAMAAEPTPVKQIYMAAQIPPATEIPALGPAIERFQRSLALLSDSHALNTGAITSIAEQRTELDTRETELRLMIAVAESKRGWFAEFKDWIEGVAAFLDEKFPRLERLEEEHLSILRERAEMIVRRRSADDENDLSAVYGPVPKPSAESNVDELRRVSPTSNCVVLRREQRGARVARRVRRHAAKMPSGADDREEGYSTDSSLTQSDALDYQRALERVIADGRDILSDVRSVEFKDPNRGLAKWFGEWRERYADSYIGAWGGLGLVGAWEFWVRLELLGWNPFESQRSLDQFPWYSSLYQYSRPVGGSEKIDEPELGPDGDIVSAMVSAAAVPRLCKMVEAGALDPYSARDVRRMIDLAEQVEASIGTDCNKFQMILKSVHTVFDSATSNAEDLLSPFVNLNCPPFDPEAGPARRRLLSRAIKLLENMLRWRKYAGDKHAVGKLCDSHPTTGVRELNKSNVDRIHLNVVIHHLAQTHLKGLNTFI